MQEFGDGSSVAQWVLGNILNESRLKISCRENKMAAAVSQSVRLMSHAQLTAIHHCRLRPLSTRERICLLPRLQFNVNLLSHSSGSSKTCFLLVSCNRRKTLLRSSSRRIRVNCTQMFSPVSAAWTEKQSSWLFCRFKTIYRIEVNEFGKYCLCMRCKRLLSFEKREKKQ